MNGMFAWQLDTAVLVPRWYGRRLIVHAQVMAKVVHRNLSNKWKFM